MSVLTVAVDKKGKAQISVKGTQGAACSTQTKRYQDALGVVVEDEKTAEYYQNPEEKVRVQATNTGS